MWQWFFTQRIERIWISEEITNLEDSLLTKPMSCDASLMAFYKSMVGRSVFSSALSCFPNVLILTHDGQRPNH